jgi:hypothetical protein
MFPLARKPIVYVSSTIVDLKDHRAELKLALEKAQNDVECMEMYSAFEERPQDKCLAIGPRRPTPIARRSPRWSTMRLVATRSGFGLSSRLTPTIPG